MFSGNRSLITVRHIFWIFMTTYRNECGLLSLPFKSVFLHGTSLKISHLPAQAGSLLSQCLLTALEPASEASQFLCI